MGILDFWKKKEPVAATAPTSSSDMGSEKPLSNEEMAAAESEAESAPEEAPVDTDAGSGDSAE